MAQENPLGRWDLRVEDDRQRVIVEGTVRLTAYKGDGCMSGDWRKVEVEWSRRPNAGSFPIDEPLTWRLDQGQLIIGRNGVCDGYLHLVGPWKNGEPMAGDYISLGMGGATTLGRFTLKHAAPITRSQRGIARSAAPPDTLGSTVVLALFGALSLGFISHGVVAIRRRSVDISRNSPTPILRSGRDAVRIGILFILMGIVCLLFLGYMLWTMAPN